MKEINDYIITRLFYNTMYSELKRILKCFQFFWDTGHVRQPQTISRNKVYLLLVDYRWTQDQQYAHRKLKFHCSIQGWLTVAVNPKMSSIVLPMVLYIQEEGWWLTLSWQFSCLSCTGIFVACIPCFYHLIQKSTQLPEYF